MQVSEHLTQRDSPKLHNSYFMRDARWCSSCPEETHKPGITKAEKGTTHLQAQQQRKCPRFNMTLSYVALFIEKRKRIF